jgi:hypothetical protein
VDIPRRDSILSGMKTSFREATPAFLGRFSAGSEDQGWIDFRDQCRRQMRRPLDARIQFGFCRMYKPVLDDAPWRVFDSMTAYRAWCAANLPAYLGFKAAVK